MRQSKLVKDAILLSLHAAQPVGLRGGAVGMGMRFLNIPTLSETRINRFLKGVCLRGFAEPDNGIFSITPAGMKRLNALELV